MSGSSSANVRAGPGPCRGSRTAPSSRRGRRPAPSRARARGGRRRRRCATPALAGAAPAAAAWPVRWLSDASDAMVQIGEQRLLPDVGQPRKAHADKANRARSRPGRAAAGGPWRSASPASVVAYGSVADRVSVLMSDFFSLTVTVRAPRPSSQQPAVGVLADRTDRLAQLIERGQVLGERGLGADLLGPARSATGRSSMPRASRCSAGPTVAPRMLATSASRQRGELHRWSRCPAGAASPRRPARSPTAGAPAARRAACAPRRGRTTRMPSGLARPEAILAICLPDPAPTEATSPVSARTLARSCSQNRSTSAAHGPDEFGRLAERLVERQLFEHRHHGAHGLEHPAAGHPVHARRAAAAPPRRRRPAGGPGASASPSGRRTPGPRSWRPPPPRGRRARRPAPAGPAAWAGSAAPRTRRTRPCRGAAPTARPRTGRC